MQIFKMPLSVYGHLENYHRSVWLLIVVTLFIQYNHATLPSSYLLANDQQDDVRVSHHNGIRSQGGAPKTPAGSTIRQCVTNASVPHWASTTFTYLPPRCCDCAIALVYSAILSCPGLIIINHAFAIVFYPENTLSRFSVCVCVFPIICWYVFVIRTLCGQWPKLRLPVVHFVRSVFFSYVYTRMFVPDSTTYYV